MSLPAALSALADYRQFILFKLVPSMTKPGKMDKLPCSPCSGQVIDAHDPRHWATSSEAFAVAPLFGPSYGVGFVITESDPFFCLDIDSAYSQGQWSPIANQLCAMFNGAAMEISQSGTGLHIWGKANVIEHGCKNTALGLELYHKERFIALGQPNAIGNAALDCTLAFQATAVQYFPATPVSQEYADWTTEPCPEWRGPADDDELIRRMLASKPSTASMFGGRATVADLWHANEAALIASYPSASENQVYGQSEADAALLQHLAFWTGRDMERMRRLGMRSALKRDKWEREDYLVRSIMRACSISNSVYQEKQADTDITEAVNAPKTVPTTGSGRLVNGHTFVSPEEQLKIWQGFTYVTDINMILTATGQQLGPEQFKNRFGGSEFIMDAANGKMTTNAWEAFTQSRATRMPKVDHLSFRPDFDPNAVWERDGETFVNSYRQLNISRVKGDPTPFLQHLAKVLPVKRDQEILLAYMAAIVQYQGTKFQWAPILQGVDGNGKTLFSRCVAEAVGLRYSHMPRASEIAEKFNEWLVGKIFIGVEDVYYPEGRTEIIETLKPMVTNSRQPIRAMRSAERTMEVCANFIVNSNHKDAIRKTQNDRRWCTLFCAQQEAEDLVRDGLNDAYFGKLYGWLNEGGYAIVTDFLYSYAIPAEFGLSCLLSRAPVTSSTEEAILIGMGAIEQEIQESILAAEPGFANGWVSSTALNNLLIERRMDIKMPRAKRRALMKTLGYDWHPSLKDGRLTSPIPGTHDRPVIFIRKDHWALGLKDGKDIVKAYLAAQMPGPSIGIVNQGVGT